MGEDPDDPERRRDRSSGEDQREQECQRPEDEREDQRGDRDRDEELAHLEVVCEDGVEVVLDRRLPRDVDRRAGNLARRFAHVVRVALRVGRLEARDDGRAHDCAGDGLNARELAGGEHLGSRLRALTDRGQEPLSRPRLSLHDDAERADGLLAEMLLQDVLGAGRVGSRERKAVRQEVAEPRGRVHPHEKKGRPCRDDPPAIADHRPRPAFH